MADWNNPSLSTAYATFLSEMKARDVDAISLAMSPTNPASGFKRWNTGTLLFQNYNGATWDDLVIAVAGGGTGAATAAGARTNLGLGTMATQAAASVAITGGTVTDVDITYTADNVKTIGSNTYRPAKLYLRSGLVIPVGTDKYLSS